MEASLIYFVRCDRAPGADLKVIFSFMLANYAMMARMKSGLATKLSFGSMYMLRWMWPLMAWFFMVSLS